MDQVLLQIIMIDRCGTVHWWPFFIDLVQLWPCLFFSPCSMSVSILWPLFNELVHIWPLFILWPLFNDLVTNKLLLWPRCDVSVCVTLLHRSVTNDGSPLGHLTLPKWSRYSWLWPTIQWPLFMTLSSRLGCECDLWN